LLTRETAGGVTLKELSFEKALNGIIEFCTSLEELGELASTGSCC